MNKAQMRVLHFFKTYAPDSFGGTQSVIRDIARGTKPFGITSEVLSLSRDPDVNSQRIDGVWARKAQLDFELASTGVSLSVLSVFKEMAAAADLIHYHFPWPMMDVIHFLSRTDKPAVVTYHSDIVRQRVLKAAYTPLMHRFLDDASSIIATSPNYLATSPVLARHRDKVTVIPIGTGDIARRPLPEARRQHWRQVLGERFFIFVGALRYYKGLQFLLDAAEETGFPVAIVGKGRQAKQLATEVKARGLKNVHLLGEVAEDEKALLLDMAYGFVFPSHLRSEAFGVALVEAAASSLPMISCEIGTGTSYVNQHGETGLVIPPADAPALARAMRQLWENRTQTQQMGENARLRYEAMFTARQMGAAHAQLYAEVMEASRGPQSQVA
jgi:glycosyltransferase involved in cell wall biosynthesis